MEHEILTRQQAIENGKYKYFTGKPCKRGHLSQRNTITASCLGCLAGYQKANRRKVQVLAWLQSIDAHQVTYTVHPEDQHFVETFARYLNEWRMNPVGVDYSEQLMQCILSIDSVRRFSNGT